MVYNDNVVEEDDDKRDGRLQPSPARKQSYSMLTVIRNRPTEHWHHHRMPRRYSRPIPAPAG